MAVTLDAEVAGASANCYLTLAEALVYIADERLDDPPAEWTAADSDKQSKALIRATREIDARMTGTKYSLCQALRFPRAVDRDRADVLGAPYIPSAVKAATVELALWLLSRPTDATMRENLQAQGVQSVTLGKISESFRGGARSVVDTCPAAVSLLRQVGYGGPVALG